MEFKKQALKLEDLLQDLSKEIDEKRKNRFELAFRSLGYQNDYCRYHHEQFKAEHHHHLMAMQGELIEQEVQNPHYYRIAFEAHCFAFFRAFHALIESIPYMLNILIDIEMNSENRNIKWTSITNAPKSKKFSFGIAKICELRNLDSYKELEHIVNVSKHRRLIKIDSGIFSDSSSAQFCAADFEIEFRNYEITSLMETIYDDLFPKLIELIQSFMSERPRFAT